MAQRRRGRNNGSKKKKNYENSNRKTNSKPQAKSAGAASAASLSSPTNSVESNNNDFFDKAVENNNDDNNNEAPPTQVTNDSTSTPELTPSASSAPASYEKTATNTEDNGTSSGDSNGKSHDASNNEKSSMATKTKASSKNKKKKSKTTNRSLSLSTSSKKSSSSSSAPKSITGLMKSFGTVVYQAAVLCSICLAVYLLNTELKRVDRPIQNFLQKFCTKHAYYCHKYIQIGAHTRSLHSIQPIRSGQVLYDIPERYHITTELALENVLLQALKKDLPLLDDGALVATYLCHANYDIYTDNDNEQGEPYPNWLLDYIQTLPDDYHKWHPILWPTTKQEQLLNNTLALTWVQHFKKHLDMEYSMMEYNDNFACPSQNDYERFRLVVWTRSFVLSSDEIDTPLGDKLASEFDWFLPEKKHYPSIRVVPIVDMLQHHRRGFVDLQWAYDIDGDSKEVDTTTTTGQDEPSKTLQVISLSGIATGRELFVSYDKHVSEQWLFAKYGFVTGDGSSPVAASLAVYHDPLTLAQDKKSSSSASDESIKLLEYLRFDDGYESCLNPNDDDNKNDENILKALELKKLKYQVLKTHMGNDLRYWTIQGKPRRPTMNPPATSSFVWNNYTETLIPPPFFVPPNVTDLFFPLVPVTCRLITTTINDFKGAALKLLKEMLNDDNKKQQQPEALFMTKSNDEHEYRTLSCIDRLTKTALTNYNIVSSTKRDADLILQMIRQAMASNNKNYNNNNNNAIRLMTTKKDKMFNYQNSKWMSSHVRLGEMHNIESVHDYVSTIQQETEKKYPEFIKELKQNKYRKCPLEYSKYVLEE